MTHPPDTAATTDDGVDPVDLWARAAIGEISSLEDPTGRNIADAARAKLFGANVSGANIETRRSRGAGPTVAPDETEELTRGAVVGRYLLLGRLGDGGMGVVYAAYDPELDRRVALKLVSPRVKGDADGGRTRLVREAQALAKLSHPNVVAVHDVGTRGEHVWIAMEFVTGETLREWARRRERKWPELLRVLTDVARGVAAAHAVGLVHRDLKPANVMIGSDGRVRVVDFGLAHGRLRAGPEQEFDVTLEAGSEAHPEVAALSLRLTRTGAVQGTPAYMAPEQWRGMDAGAAADQFGWSVMAWELLYGERPFPGATPRALEAAVLAGQRRPPPRGRSVPHWLRRVVERGLATEPSQRWPTMAALLAGLQRGQTQARVRTVMVVLSGVMALAAGIEGYRRWDVAQRVATCEITGDRIDSVWNDEARVAIRGSLEATGIGQATVTADLLMPWFDQYADEWRAARVDECMHTYVHASWDDATHIGAVWCLDERLQGLDALIDELVRADATTLNWAIPAASRLGSIQPCIEPAQLRNKPVPPLAERERIWAIRGVLSRASVLHAAGKYPQARIAVVQAREQAEALGWPPLRAEALAREGDILDDAGDYAGAERASREAYLEATRLDQWDVAASAANALIFNVGRHQARYAEGRLWAQLAEVAAVHVGDPQRMREADRLTHLGRVAGSEGAYAEAIALHERALALHEQALGPEHPRIAGDLGNLADIQTLSGAYSAAQALLERALVIQERRLGPEHPDVALTLNHLTNTHRMQGDYDAARTAIGRALRIFRQSLDPEHPSVAWALDNLAATHLMSGSYAPVQALLERSLAIRTSVGRRDAGFAFTLNLLGLFNEHKGDFAAARRFYAESLRIREAALGPEHLSTAESFTNLANVASIAGDAVYAEDLHRRALAILRKHLGSRHPGVATSLNNLGIAQQIQGKLADAQSSHEKALSIREAVFGPNHGEVAMSLTNLALVQRERSDFTAARRFLERAMSINESMLGSTHPRVGATLTWLAEVYVAEGRPEAALPLLERAMSILAAHEGLQTNELETHFLLARALVLTNPRARTRAQAAAQFARDGFAAVGDAKAKEVAEIDAWLARQVRSQRRGRPR